MTRVPHSPRTRDSLPFESGARSAVTAYAGRLLVLAEVALGSLIAVGFVVVVVYFVATQSTLWISLIVAGVSAAGLAASPGLLARRRRISYRVLYDAPIRGGSDPDIVLIRLSNDGFTDISEDDWAAPLAITFKGRRVVSAELTGDPAKEPWKVRETPQGMGPREDRLELPGMALRRGEQVRLLAVLAGDRPGSTAAPDIEGRLRHGKMRAAGPASRRGLVASAVAVLLLAGLSLGLVLVRPWAGPTAATCAQGSLTLTGSTAFAPVAAGLAKQYADACPGAVVDFKAADSTPSALAELDIHGDHAGDSLAFASGAVNQAGYPSLVAHPVGVLIYSIVVNKSTGVSSLTSAQIRGIYSGAYQNWRQVGGSDLPIFAVSTDAESATRIAFDQKILGLEPQAPTAGGCASSARQCTVDSTNAVLNAVASLPGAIGYLPTTAVPAATQASPGQIRQVKLNGITASPPQVLAGAYPFWSIQYLYSYGLPIPGSPSSAFISYLGTGAARSILEANGYIACGPAQLCG